MRLIFVTREGYQLPGARIRCYNFSRNLREFGIDTGVLSFSDTLGAKDGANESQMNLFEKFKLNLRAIKILSREKKTVLYIQRFNYHSLAPYLVHIFYKNRIILDIDDWEMREDPKYYLGFYPSSKAYYFTKQIARRSIACIAASRFLQEFLSQFKKDVHYIPTGVDTALFNPHREFGSNDRKDNAVIFSWVGTLHRKEYVENIQFVLDCFISLRKKYPLIYFEIAAEGIYKNLLLDILSNYKDNNITLKGWIDPDQMPGYLSGIDIGLMPVLRDNKFNRAKSPTKIFEYMAMAKPVIASDVGEPRYIISDAKNGFLAQTKDDFAEKMRMLIEDIELRRKIGKEARKTVEEKYSLDILGKKLYEILKFL